MQDSLRAGARRTRFHRHPSKGPGIRQENDTHTYGPKMKKIVNLIQHYFCGARFGRESLFVLPLVATLTGCSGGQMIARASMPMIETGLLSINRETDIELARLAIPSNLKMVETFILEDPANERFKIHAAMGYYSYTLSYIEDEDRQRASVLYKRGFDYARSALRLSGLNHDVLTASLPDVERDAARLNKNAVAGLFWTAACWAKWIEMNLDDPARLADLGKAAALMRRVIELDEGYFHGGAHLFFGVYFGGRSTLLGGDFALSARHFDRAREITHGKLLFVDVYRAQYLLRHQGNKDSFHATLTGVINAPSDLEPELAFANAVAKKKARSLLANEEVLF